MDTPSHPPSAAVSTTTNSLKPSGTSLLTTADSERIVRAVVSLGLLMNRTPAVQHSRAMCEYFAEFGWTVSEVETARRDILASGDLMQMISIDGSITPRPFVAWRELRRGKTDAKMYTHREACDVFDKFGGNARFDEHFQPVKTDAGVRFQRIA